MRSSPDGLSMDGLWILDIETVPADAVLGSGVIVPPDAYEAIPVAEPERRRVPSGWRDPKKIAQREAENAEQYRADLAAAEAAHAVECERLYRRRALHPLQCRVVVVAMMPADGSEAPIVITGHNAGGDGTERSLVRELARVVADRSIRGMLCWGNFDGPVLRAAVARCADDAAAWLLSDLLRADIRGRAWMPAMCDPSELTAVRLGGARSGWGLKGLASLHGLEDGAPVASSAVLDAYAAGDIAGIAERCAEDVRLTHAVISAESLWSDVARWFAGIQGYGDVTG